MKHKKGYLNEHLGIIIMLTMSNVTRLVNNVHYMPSVVKFPNKVLTNYISFLLLCFNYILAHLMMINSNIFIFSGGLQMTQPKSVHFALRSLHKSGENITVGSVEKFSVASVVMRR